MTYEIIIAKRVEKFIDKLEAKECERILFALDKLKIRPEAYVTRLVGEKLYKFRVGNYRILLDIEKNKILIFIVQIGHRKKVYD